MLDLLTPLARTAAAFTELLGVLVIVSMTGSALALGSMRLIRHGPSDVLYDQVRQHVARGILLGLEFLVAADIIHTVAVDLSFKSVGVLAMILLIRSFLSLTLELELTGKWPWQQER